MGERGEIFSNRVYVDEGQKTYFFNIKENRFGDIYLNIVESRKTERGFQRSSIVVFKEDLDSFIIRLDRTVADIRQNRKSSGQTLIVGKGRREYRMSLDKRRKPALRISEERQDPEKNPHRELVIISLDVLDVFMDGFRKSLRYIQPA